MKGKSIRSIMKSGGSLVISLPREWVERLELRAGESLSVEVAGDSLILSPVAVNRREKSLRLKFESNLPILVNKITAAYLLGYDEIELEIPPAVKREIEEALSKVKNKLLGLEILEGVGGSLLLRVLVNPESVKPIDVLKRMWALSGESIEDSVTALIGYDRELAEIVIDRDEEVDRLYFYMVRMLRSCAADPTLLTHLNLTSINVLDYRLVAYLLENITDRAVELAELAKRDEELDKEFREALAEAKQLLSENHYYAMRVFLNREVDLLEEIRRKTAEIRERFAPSHPTTKKLQIHEEITSIARMQYDIADLIQLLPL